MITKLYPVQPLRTVLPKTPATSELEIRPVANIQEMDAVYQLTHDTYVAKGYASAQDNGLLSDYPEFDVVPETTVLVAIQDGEVVGSMSCSLTGPQGLPIDHEFETERRAVEQEGRVVVNIWRLVVKESCRASRKVVFGLFAEGFRRTLGQKVTTWLLTVNPQHEGLYQRLLNSRIISRKVATEGLSNAPAVLLRFDKETLPKDWKLYDSAIQSPSPVGLMALPAFFDDFPAW